MQQSARVKFTICPHCFSPVAPANVRLRRRARLRCCSWGRRSIASHDVSCLHLSLPSQHNTSTPKHRSAHVIPNLTSNPSPTVRLIQPDMKSAAASLKLAPFSPVGACRYHCCSLLDNGFDVDLIGSQGAQLPLHLRTNTRFKMYGMSPVMQRQWPRAFFIAFAAIKLLLQSLQLLYQLLIVPRPSFYVVFYPPPPSSPQT
jgi:hypothetical protein